MKRVNPPHSPAVAVRRHPPERLVRALAQGGVATANCSCCCCCCLHSVGSLAGAVVGSYRPAGTSDRRDKEAPPLGLLDDELDRLVAAAPARPRPVVTTIFRRSAIALTVLTLVVPPLISAERSAERGLTLGLELILFGCPVVLLGGAAVSAFVIAVRPSLRGDVGEWKRLGWITLGILVGALIGGLVVVPFFR
jgi:hypothetical protein